GLSGARAAIELRRGRPRLSRQPLPRLRLLLLRLPIRAAARVPAELSENARGHPPADVQQIRLAKSALRAVPTQWNNRRPRRRRKPGAGLVGDVFFHRAVGAAW